MKKRLKCLCTCLLVTTIFVGCTQTNSVAKATPQLSALPNYEQKGEIEIDAWLGPKLSEESIKAYADCGYTIFHMPSSVFDLMGQSAMSKYSDALLNEKLDRVFTLAEQNGLKVVLANTAFNTSATYMVPFEYVYSRIGETLEKWKDNDTFYGFMVSDETTLDKPLTVTYKELKYMSESYERSVDFIRDDYLYFNSLFPGKYYETVLLGIRNGADVNMPYFTDSTRTFEEYMDCYYEDCLKYIPVEDRVYSFDAYPITDLADGSYEFQDRFVGSLEGIAERAENAGASKTAYIQNHRGILNSEMVSYQYYTAMCYGFTHFTTYCYMNVWGETQYSATYGGEETDNYYYFQEAHRQLDAFKTVYSNFAGKRVGNMAVQGSKREENSVATWVKCKNLEDNLPIIRSVDATQDLLIGCFQDSDNNYGFMLANQMMPDSKETNTVELKLAGTNKVAVWQDGKDVEIIETSGGRLALELASGGGAFLVPMK